MKILFSILLFIASSAYALNNKQLGKLLLKDNYKKVTQKYNVYYHSKRGCHPGIDYKAKIGTPVYSPVNGKIEKIRGDLGGVIIDIDNDSNYFILLHLSSFNVKKGERIKIGQLLGKSGAKTKEGQGEPHLHVEYRKTPGPALYFKSKKLADGTLCKNNTGRNIHPTKIKTRFINSLHNPKSKKYKKSKSKKLNGKMITKGYLALNGHYLKQYGKVNLWKKSPNDIDQRWKFKNMQIKRANSNYCLTSSHRKSKGRVFLDKCNTKNLRQRWKIYNANNNKKQIRLLGTKFCLNAYKAKHKSTLNTYRCDRSDTDQQFIIR
jgi:hypothetical protein